MAEIPLEECDGCLACFYACPRRCITVRGEEPLIDYSLCIGCFQCVEVCRDRHKSSGSRVLRYLPGLDCGDCGRGSCKSFAEGIEKEGDLNGCKRLSKELKEALGYTLFPESHFTPYPISEQTTPTKAGIFELGEPGKDSPVVVSSDYLYSVQRVTEVLGFSGISAYILVVPAQGYCMRLAATLGTVDEEELARMLKEVGQGSVILPPQLKKLGIDGKKVIYGPKNIEELPAFLIKENLIDTR